MAELKPVALIVRWAAQSMAANLRFIPEEKLDWKPTPESKSAAAVAGEAIGVMRMMMPLFQGGGFEPSPFPQPASIEEACALLAETAEQYAAALEAAGPELERPVDTPFGQLWGERAVVFGMVDLVHHHGHVTYIQTLLGDAENHTDWSQVTRWFGPPQQG